MNPNGPACPRFTPKNLTLPPMRQKTQNTHGFISTQIIKDTSSEVNLAELKHRLDEAEIKLRKIKDMLNKIK